jgi:hypothetical protein
VSFLVLVLVFETPTASRPRRTSKNPGRTGTFPPNENRES